MSESSEDRKKLKAEAAAKKAEAKALRPWFKKKRFVIPAAFVALGVITSVSGGSSSSKGTASTNSKGSSISNSSISKIGQEARDGKFSFTVNSVKCGVKNVGSYYFTDKTQGTFCVLDLMVKNIGNEAQSVSSDNMYLFDKDNRKFSTTNTVMLDLPNYNLWYQDINPGNFIQGQLIFDLPKGVIPVKAELHDSMFSDGVEVSLK